MGRTIKAAAHHNDQWVGDETRWTSPLAKCKNRPTYQRSSLVHRVLPYLLTYRLLVVLLLPLLSLLLLLLLLLLQLLLLLVSGFFVATVIVLSAVSV